ncbi:guanine deaminase GuaD [Gottschalkia purinilytica]|uniref:Guanine deaminase n=1 Tax=Gottschalkia purinilytica TaxID=1503 RepID=A0A0L0W967_GOTPU|nr:guanine deaminase [Gottschalkia purinilytica]KNF07976.1 guanine deaminase GuaD [Gottschalkia purinilytica]
MSNQSIKIFKGNIVFTKTKNEFTILENGYIVIKDDKIEEVSSSIPEKYKDINVIDHGNKLIIPGFVDTHLHAPQFPNRGLGLDKELLPWLETYTFPEEAKYSDLNYAKKVYKRLISELWKNGVTRSCIFNTIHKESTKLLLDMFIKSGLGAFVGKVNMDRNSSSDLTENTQQSLKDTEEILREYIDKSDIVKPIVTPRFVPSCTPELMKGLGELAKKYNAHVQSHLSENPSEVAWVKELHPEFDTYGSVYDHFGLFGQQPTVMAHCVHSDDNEISLMKKNGVFVSHCPHSNYNLSSGIAPVRKFLNQGVKVSLGSDISGGHTASSLHCMVAAVQASKMRWIDSEGELDSLTTSEAFYLATKGGGEFFGKVGSFEKEYDFDALIIDDRNLGELDITIKERIQRFIYIGDDRNILERYVTGKKIEEPKFD